MLMRPEPRISRPRRSDAGWLGLQEGLKLGEGGWVCIQCSRRFTLEMLENVRRREIRLIHFRDPVKKAIQRPRGASDERGPR